jgi:glycosyltransferase involved in cell wall biosynthesis
MVSQPDSAKSIFIFHDFQGIDYDQEIGFTDSYARFLSAISQGFAHFLITARLVKPTSIAQVFTVPKSNIAAISYNGILDVFKNPFNVIAELNRLAKCADDYDVLFLSWPHPLALKMAFRNSKSKTIIFIVRQNLRRIVKAKYQGLLKTTLLFAIALLELAHRYFFKHNLILVVGSEMFTALKSKGYTQAVLIQDPVISLRDINPKPRMAPSQNRLLFVGRLEKEKGCKELILGFNEAIKTHPDLRLTVIGDGAEKQTISQLIRNLKLEGRVELKGHLDFGPKLFACYQNSDILIIPSYSEGFPKVIGEARAFGLPIIATNVGGMANQEHLSSGIYKISANNPDAISKSIQFLYANTDLYHLLSANSALNFDNHTIEYWSEYVENLITIAHHEKSRGFRNHAEL